VKNRERERTRACVRACVRARAREGNVRSERDRQKSWQYVLRIGVCV